MSQTRRPAVTISLVTWHGLRWLPGCLDSVAQQTLTDYELLILDNGSSDGSVEWLRDRVAGDDRISLVESSTNLGYALGHDRNIDAARGEAVLLLNQDVVLDPGFLTAVVAVLDARAEVGSVQGLVRRLAPDGERLDVIDTTGLSMHRDRRVVSRQQLERAGHPGSTQAGPVWGVDGAVPVYRRAALDMARLPSSRGGDEVLDSDFFAYKEDVDLAWRLARLGWTAWYEPAALAWHARGGGDTGAQGWRAVVAANMANPPRVRALSWRNQRLMQVKNEERGRFLRDLPWIARRELMAWLFMVVADPGRLRAVPELLQALPWAWRKRRALEARLRPQGPDRGEGSHASVSKLASRLRVTNVGRTLGYTRQHGLRRTARRLRDAMWEPLWVVLHRRELDLGVRQVHPGRIQARIDAPGFEEPTGFAHLFVHGWAHAEAGIESVELYVASRSAGRAAVGRSRPDVATAWRHLDPATIEGFAGLASLDGVALGHAALSVVIRDRAGNTRVLARRFRRLDAAVAYQRYYEQTMARPAGRRTAGLADRPHPAIHLVVIDRGGADLAASLRSVAEQDVPRLTCTVLAQPGEVEGARAQAPYWLGSASEARWTVTDAASGILPTEPDPDGLIGFIVAGEVLFRSAVREMAHAASAAGVRLVYSDHDAIDAAGMHRDPWFLPTWSPYRLLAQDYVGGVFLLRDDAIVREQVMSALDGVREPGWRYRLLLGLDCDDGEVVRLPRVLWSRPPGTEVPGPQGEAAVRATAERGSIGGVEVVTGQWPSGPVRSLHWRDPDPLPLVSAIVPTTGRPELVRGLLTLLREGTAYPHLETIVLDNGRGRHADGIALLAEAGLTIIERDEAFNWARLSNAGATHATGEFLLFLNDDMEAIDPGWLHQLVNLAARPDVGAAGPLLLYPDGAIQHAGVLLVGYGGGAAHLLQGLDPERALYLDLQHVLREVSAVTGACLLTRRDIFEEVGGFDEHFVVSGNDVDFCLRLRATGRRILWTPESVLIHHEGRSRRGVDYLGDEGRLWSRWGELLRSGDPYYDPNLSQQRADCDLDWSRVSV